MARISQQTKEETRAAIIAAAVTLFTESGYDKTNTKAIAKACGIAEGTVFNYFANKDEILMAVFEQMAAASDSDIIPPSLQPTTLLVNLLLEPLRKMNRMSKSLLMDIIIAALKLSKGENSLLRKLIALDMTYVKQVEEKMGVFLKFNDVPMDAKQLSELLYALISSEYLKYLLDPSMSYDAFEHIVYSKAEALLHPYL